MKTLLWREFHWNRLILVMGASILVLPYVITLIVGLWPHDGGIRFDRRHFTTAAAYSFILSQLTIVFFAGNAFAGERADRSAQFLAYLPISRKDRLLSKLCLAAFLVFAIVFVNLFVYRIASGGFPWQKPEGFTDFVFTDFIRNVGSTSLVVFGVGWFISSVQSSPTFAVGGGILMPLLTAIGLAIAESGFEIRNQDFFATWYVTISVTLGTLGFVLGTWLFLKRVEP